jgi:hypothetical protein
LNIAKYFFRKTSFIRQKTLKRNYFFCVAKKDPKEKLLRNLILNEALWKLYFSVLSRTSSGSYFFLDLCGLDQLLAGNEVNVAGSIEAADDDAINSGGNDLEFNNQFVHRLYQKARPSL